MKKLPSTKIIFTFQIYNKLDLSHHIEDLLYTNDCVIVPTIGGFIANYAPASIDFIEQQLYPPQKSVSFNPKLVNNDGLLTNHLVQKEHLSYKQAALKVDEFSRQIEDDLFKNRIVHFPNVGKLYFNSDSKLEFVPNNTNFLLDAYGLPSIACTPVLRNKDYLIKEKEAKDKESKTKLTIKKPEKAPFVLTPAAKRTIAVAAASLLLLFSTPYIYSWLFSNQTTITIADNNHTTDSNTTTSNASIIPTILPDVKDTVAEVVEVITKEEIPVVKEKPIVSDNAQAYVIVLGAFGKKANAERMAEKLVKDNYLPDVTPKNGLSRVGVQITCTPEELKTHLKFLQDNYNPKAWVVE